jgi:excisionase family DNA binding protein
MNEERQMNERMLVSVKMAADMLGVSVRTIWRMIADKQLGVSRIRSCTRVVRESVEAYQRQAKGT